MEEVAKTFRETICCCSRERKTLEQRKDEHLNCLMNLAPISVNCCTVRRRENYVILANWPIGNALITDVRMGHITKLVDNTIGLVSP